jgi:hypothetical protein
MNNILSAGLSRSMKVSNEDNEQEELVQRGEMTPFGTVVMANSSVS